jgi:ABC-2 type transport system ATP-binding protein
MLRRLNIAAGILHEPRIVLFDEPTVGLDPQSRAAILDLVRAIATNAAVVYTTHYLDEAERLCDRLAIIDHGTVLAEGSLAELRNAAGSARLSRCAASSEPRPFRPPSASMRISS